MRRKLANLARVRWPSASRPHRIAVVDDGSEDETAQLARTASTELFANRSDVEVVLVANEHGPGKAGAIASGIEACRSNGSTLLVLTDADVVFMEDALVCLTVAFVHPRTGMATGSQVFVRDLSDDGSPCARNGGELVRADAFFDRFTAVARRIESRFGKLFSVHGQLLAWRADLGLVPEPGIAADDLDLVLAVRARGLSVVRVEDAVFVEVKTAAGSALESQALRRAHAYFQALRRPGRSLGNSIVDRIQWWFYANVPERLPELLLGGAFACMAGGYGAGSWSGVALCGALLLLVARIPLGRELLFLARVIARARRAGALPVSDRWEMERP